MIPPGDPALRSDDRETRHMSITEIVRYLTDYVADLPVVRAPIDGNMIPRVEAEAAAELHRMGLDELTCRARILGPVGWRELRITVHDPENPQATYKATARRELRGALVLAGVTGSGGKP